VTGLADDTEGAGVSDSILVTREGGLARVTFNRPAVLNAMDFEMGRLWRDIAHELTSDDSVGAVILDAAGPAFCAGATSSRWRRRARRGRT
jgi:2-(1,2-epoxy-1,2-dihydrophenyl)acetyl-CoA isomerase